jgi:DNA-binding PadR family transcriptional regulator
LAPDRTKLRQGTPEMMILKALTVEEMHGMGISHRIAEIAIC